MELSSILLPLKRFRDQSVPLDTGLKPGVNEKAGLYGTSPFEAMVPRGEGRRRMPFLTVGLPDTRLFS